MCASRAQTGFVKSGSDLKRLHASVWMVTKIRLLYLFLFLFLFLFVFSGLFSCQTLKLRPHVFASGPLMVHLRILDADLSSSGPPAVRLWD